MGALPKPGPPNSFAKVFSLGGLWASRVETGGVASVWVDHAGGGGRPAGDGQAHALRFESPRSSACFGVKNLDLPTTSSMSAQIGRLFGRKGRHSAYIVSGSSRSNPPVATRIQTKNCVVASGCFGSGRRTSFGTCFLAWTWTIRGTSPWRTCS